MALLVNAARRENAQLAQDMTSLEPVTSQFWSGILQGEFPEADGYFIAPEQPPGGPGRRRVDIKVACYPRRYPQGVQRRLIYAEFKRADEYTQHGRDAAEQQVYNYCVDWLRSRPQQRWILAMVCIGVYARVWTVGAAGGMAINLDWFDASRPLGDRGCQLVEALLWPTANEQSPSGLNVDHFPL